MIEPGTVADQTFELDGVRFVPEHGDVERAYRDGTLVGVISIDEIWKRWQARKLVVADGRTPEWSPDRPMRCLAEARVHRQQGQSMSIRPPRFGQKAAERAYDEWGCNCGPGAIAAICDLTLDEVRLHMGDFERKGYTNPTMMLHALESVGARFRCRGLADNVKLLDWPRYGLARVQWEGPWSQPGMNPRWGYRHTHWVGVARKNSTTGIFDINCMQNGSGWVDLIDWQEMVVPWILKNCVPRANGKWHITDAIEVAPPTAVAGAVA